MEIEEAEQALERVSVRSDKPLIVVGIPAYNEEKSIARVVLQAQKYCDRVVVCDDGSVDLTAEIAERLGADVIRHRSNLGYGAAIQSLFKHCIELDADVLVTLDADGQHYPQEIPNVVKPIANGAADVVIGSRFLDEHSAKVMPWYRRAGVKLITKLVNNNAKHSVRDSQSGFRAYNRKSLEALKVMENGMGASAEILIGARKEGLRIREVSSSCNYDDHRDTSTHNPAKHLLDVIMSIVKLVVEDKPLTLLGIPGVMCIVVGSFFSVWMLQIYSLEHRIVTNVALASIAFTLIGFFALSSAITLYAITRLAERIGKE